MRHNIFSNKTLLGLCCFSTLLCGCKKNKIPEYNLNQEISLVDTSISHVGSNLIVTMDFDDDNNPSTIEWRGLRVFDKHEGAGASRAEYVKAIRSIKQGTRGTVENWGRIVQVFELNR